MIKKRDIFLFILFNILTLGIYGIVVYCFIGKEVNKICEADGKNQMLYILHGCSALLHSVYFRLFG